MDGFTAKWTQQAWTMMLRAGNKEKEASRRERRRRGRGPSFPFPARSGLAQALCGLASGLRSRPPGSAFGPWSSDKK
eukprot:8896933-Pyramimonas_sp.AAC.1